MEIKDLATFKKLLSICRDAGVEKIRVGDIEVTLGEIALKKQKSPTTSKTNTPDAPNYAITEETSIPNELTQEQLLFYSSIPHAEESPN